MGTRRRLGIGGEVRSDALGMVGSRLRAAEVLIGHVGVFDVYGDAVGGMGVEAGVAPGRNIDLEHGDIVVLEHRQMPGRLLDRHGRPFILRAPPAVTRRVTKPLIRP
jgi:hypothetical protein